MRLNIDQFNNLKKKLFLIISDLIIISLSIAISFSLRMETIFFINDIDLRIYIIFYFVFLFVFFINNVYQILLRYFDFFSIKKITISVLICLVILIPINLILYKYFFFPRSISFIASIICGILIVSHRILINFLINLNFANKKNLNNVLIIGIDNQNIEIIKNIRQNPNYGKIVGLIDTYNKYKKRELNGIKIFKKNKIYDLVENDSVNEIIIGKKTLNKKEINILFNFSEKKKNLRIVNLNKIINLNDNLIRNTLLPHVDFFDIIQRPKINVEEKVLKKKITGKNILITGGGGSIGGELCLEIIKHNPKKLYVLENSEISLFNIVNRIKKNERNNFSKLIPVLGDCNDYFFLKNFFSNRTIDEIYHAAAYKHVNFGEENSNSMIKNNVFGTKSIIEFSIYKNVKNFIFISSDKAVNPSSVLGYSKKLGEKLVKYYYSKNLNIKTNYTIVRFGNVIGSSGSVIPIFINQVANKVPVTVTSSKAKRYFMSTSEAVKLVINSSYLNNKGVKIYALDMGDQINILWIAKRIIRLSGKTIKNNKNLNGDIEIKFTGLNKGEKEVEEIVLGNNLVTTKHKNIFECNEKIGIKYLYKDLKKLENLLKNKIIKKSLFNKLHI